MENKIIEVEKVLGKCDEDGRWYDITFDKAQELLKLELLPLLLENDRGSTHQMIMDLLKKHPVLRATGTISTGNGAILDGFDVNGTPYFEPETIRDFFEFAMQYSDDFAVAPSHLFMWFD
ncbi:MAG: hypothetical protein ABSF91_11440 [Bacteroidota bacterium]|jgi:hypothetical protein